jgi:mannan endo-1,4-beta-mannosidase
MSIDCNNYQLINLMKTEILTKLFKPLLKLCLLFLFLLAADNAWTQEVMQVKGRKLYDPCGEQVVLRGVNEMFIWSDDLTGEKIMPEIAATGANVVRIVWLSDKENEKGSPENLDKIISECIRNKMFPMPELHGATGKWDKLQEQVDYWTKPEVVRVLKKHEPYLLLNIANEAGDHSIKAAEFLEGYSMAVKRIRSTGLRCPVIIDASGWGQDLNILLETGPQLIENDPLKNLMLSVHMWWAAEDGSTQRITKGIERSVDLNLPLLIGEFAPMGVGCKRSIDYHTIMKMAQKHEIGWLAWSWGAVRNGDCHEMDMTSGEKRGLYEGLHGWGREVAVSDPFSIANTSKKTYFLENLKCRSDSPSEKVIFDTDMGSDCDDAGALALLHAYAGEGKISILGCIYSSGKVPFGAGITEAINVWYGRPDIPVGAYHGNEVGDPVDKMLAEKLARDTAAFKNKIIYNKDATEQTRLNRKLLSAQEDNSVTYITVGHTKGLYELLVSEPDEFSPLTGAELVEKKIKRWVALGALNARNEKGHYVKDWNFFFNETARYTAYLTEHFPRPVYFIDGGAEVYTGKSLMATPAGNIVRTAYRDWLWNVEKKTLADQRPSWDLVTVYYAVEGLGDYLEKYDQGRLEFDAEKGCRWDNSHNNPLHFFVQQKEGTNYIFSDYLNEKLLYYPKK